MSEPTGAELYNAVRKQRAAKGLAPLSIDAIQDILDIRAAAVAAVAVAPDDSYIDHTSPTVG